MEVVSADSNGVAGIHPQQPELGATWQIHFKMARVFWSRHPYFLCCAKHALFSDRTVLPHLTAMVSEVGGSKGGGWLGRRRWCVGKTWAESEQRVKSVRVMGSPLHQAW